MGWPEPVTYLLLVVLGYALTRVIDLLVDWQRARLGAAPPATSPHTAPPTSPLTATARQRLLERQAVYARFKSRVDEAIEAAVNQGAGTYGMLYGIRDAYGELLRCAPASITQAADSVIRCVTLLVNLGPSDQRFAMLTRSLRYFDEECACDQGLRQPAVAAHREFTVLGGDLAGSLAARLAQEATGPASAATPAPTDSGSESARART